MRTMTIGNAKYKFCPMSFNQTVTDGFCLADNCMWWRQVHEEVKREDHNNGYQKMRGLKTTEGRSATLEREGPPGCTGVWILPAEGCCGAIHQNPPMYYLSTEDNKDRKL